MKDARNRDVLIRKQTFRGHFSFIRGVEEGGGGGQGRQERVSRNVCIFKRVLNKPVAVDSFLQHPHP